MNRYESKADAAYGVLREQILEGVLKAGSILRQEQIADELGMSTTPVREALRRLESESLVIMPVHRNAMVAPLDMKDFLPLFDVRAELDTMAAGLAARNYLDEDRPLLISAAQAVEVRPANRVGPMRDFYATVYHTARDRVLTAHLDGLWDQSKRFQNALRGFSDQLPFPHTYANIVDAIIERDVAKSETLMRDHLLQARLAIKKLTELARDEDLRDLEAAI